jgi:hypothetical protein
VENEKARHWGRAFRRIGSLNLWTYASRYVGERRRARDVMPEAWRAAHCRFSVGMFGFDMGANLAVAARAVKQAFDFL